MEPPPHAEEIVFFARHKKGREDEHTRVWGFGGGGGGCLGVGEKTGAGARER